MPSNGRVVVIGSGAAGSAAARTLVDAGLQVTVVEKDKVGGTCLWHGCMPKKALYRAATSMRAIQESEQFGISAVPTPDWPGVLAWKWHAQETYAGDQEHLLNDRGIELVRGDATFSDSSTLAVAGKQLSFDHAVIATGSVPVVPPVPGADLADTSAEALGYARIPESLLIVGAGYIAFELAGVFASFGTKVTVAVSSTPLKSFDPDVVAVALRHLESLGVAFVNGARLSGISTASAGFESVLRSSGGEESALVTERVLLATGRAPALETLGLANAGVELDDHGRLVLDEHLRTTNPSVWAAGDAADRFMHTPVASLHGRAVAASIISGEPVKPADSVVPTTVFTVPQLASVGMTEAEASAHGIAYRVGRTEFEFLGSAIIDDDRDGLVKLLFAEEDGRIIGAHIAARDAASLIYSMGIAVASGLTAENLRAVPGIHPAYSEALNWAAY